jgi:rhodanese-related sulfurtransferase
MLIKIGRIILLGIIALLIGLLTNQIQSNGIPWELLSHTLAMMGKSPSYNTLSADSTFFLFIQGETVMIDTRSSEAFLQDHIPRALSLPFYTYFSHPERYQLPDPNKQIILYCFEPECQQARLMAGHLTRWYPQVSVLRGGLASWIEMGFPVTRGME